MPCCMPFESMVKVKDKVKIRVRVIVIGLRLRLLILGFEINRVPMGQF